MSRIVLVHWDARAARARACRLRDAGHTVRVFTGTEPAKLKELENRPPEIFVIDLTRIPSQGRDIGTWLRGRKSTRSVPIVFAGGDVAKVASIKKLLPDATFTEWSRIRSTIRSAIGSVGNGTSANPVNPGAMAGYSGTPLPKKLGIKAGSVVVLLGAPPKFEKKLVPLPDNVHLRRQGRGRPAHRVLLFAKSRADLKRRFCRRRPGPWTREAESGAPGARRPPGWTRISISRRSVLLGWGRASSIIKSAPSTRRGPGCVLPVEKQRVSSSQHSLSPRGNGCDQGCPGTESPRVPFSPP